MIEKEIKNFDLRQIAGSGQCFRMTEIPAAIDAESGTGLTAKQDDGLLSGRSCTCSEAQPKASAAAETTAAYRIISGSRMAEAVQRGRRVLFRCGEDEFPYWEEYFDLKTDYGVYIASIDEKDSYLRAAAEAGSGIRILKQDLWEMIITFVISQQKAIPNIRALVEALCRNYGTRMEDFYAFPAPGQLNGATLEELQALKLGYRAKYIKRICEDVCSGTLDLELLRQMDYTAAMAYLKGFYGIGEKVANCVCLFGLHHVEAFPVDTWIRKILIREYACRCQKSTLERLPQTRRCEYLVRRYFARYKGYAGVMQQYMFYYERMGGTVTH